MSSVGKLRCGSGGELTPPGRFCIQCGAPMARSCPSCGEAIVLAPVVTS